MRKETIMGYKGKFSGEDAAREKRVRLCKTQKFTSLILLFYYLAILVPELVLRFYTAPQFGGRGLFMLFSGTGVSGLCRDAAFAAEGCIYFRSDFHRRSFLLLWLAAGVLYSLSALLYCKLFGRRCGCYAV